MSDQNHSPVSLPAKSFDYDDLKSALNKAARGAAKNYDQAVVTALDDAGTAVHQSHDRRNIPGYEFREVGNDLGGTEMVQVFDEKLVAADDASAGATPEAESLNHQARTHAEASARANSPQE